MATFCYLNWSIVVSIDSDDCNFNRWSCNRTSSSSSSAAAASSFSRRNSPGRVSRCSHRKREAFLCAAKIDGDDQEDPQDEEDGKTLWSTEEGRKKLDDILQMKELIAEAERLRVAAERGELGQEEEARLQEELARRAKELAEERKQAETMFQVAQGAYGRGAYGKAVKFLEAALTNVPKASNLGGEIQIWLAMAYEANNRHADCIRLYKALERSHPNSNIRRQAADLRYISEAPKLKISREERVSLPVLDSYYRSSQKTWSQMVRERKQVSRKPKPREPSAEEWLVWSPPRWEKSPYFWVALTVWLTLAGISLMFQD